MKKLLTCKEHLENVDWKYNGKGAYEVKDTNKVRGKMYQGKLTPMELESFMLLRYCFVNMGLGDYIEMEYDEESKTAIVRCIMEEDK